MTYIIVGIGAVASAIVAIIISILRIKKEKDNYRKLLTQKKQSEVVLGFISEKLSPFLEDFEYDPQRLKFLGDPIDYVHFGDEVITFIEVKSGKSRLSKKQKTIRDMVKNKRIAWYEYRINKKANDSTLTSKQ